VATARDDVAVEEHRRRALDAFDHYNDCQFDAFAACFANEVISFRPEMMVDHPKGLVALSRERYVDRLQQLREIDGPITIAGLYADRGVVVIVMRFSDGELASNTFQFTRDGLIERTFVRRGQKPSKHLNCAVSSIPRFQPLGAVLGQGDRGPPGPGGLAAQRRATSSEMGVAQN
jgi:hypothetical protein